MNLANKNLIKLPDNLPQKVEYFNCSNNKLISLEGAPRYVKGNFDCAGNNLTTLKHLPEYIGNNFWCEENKNLKFFEIIKGLWNCKIKGEIITDFEFNFNKFFKVSNYKKIKMLFEYKK